MFTLIKLLFGLKNHFLVVLQNNNEIRATGGFITKVIDVSCKNLGWKVEFRDIYRELDNHEKVESPQPLGEMLHDRRFNGWTLRDANFDPDFNKSAEKIIEFFNMVYPKKNVEGVLAINFSFIENLLDILGPIKLGEDLVTRKNLFMYISAKTADMDRHDLDSIEARKNILNKINKNLIKTSALKVHKWLKIYNLIQESFNNRNLQLWLTDTKKLAKLKLPQFKFPSNSDGLCVIDSNFLGGKSNRYIKRSIFREIEFTKENANVQLTIMWEHLGKLNYPLSTRYKGYVRIYIPKNAVTPAEQVVKTIGDFKIIDSKQVLPPGEKIVMNVAYTLPGNWLSETNAYNFKYIKQSGIYDETLVESYTLPIQYTFKNLKEKNAIIHENVCSNKQFPSKDIEYNFNIIKSEFGPRIISHELVKHDTVQIRFNEPVDISKNINFYHKKDKKTYEVKEIEWLRDRTILQFEIKSLPQKEDEFYIVELDNPATESRRTVTVVYRSKFFKE